MDPVIAHVATIPERRDQIRQVVEDIRPQVTEINVYWNGYDDVPQWADTMGYTWDTTMDDLGDAGKFYDHSEAPAYHLTIDDDLYYPDDYVERTVAAIEYYDREFAVSWHGKVLREDGWPWGSYYRGSFAYGFRCLFDEPESMFVHLPGSGVFGYHTDTIRFSIGDFTGYWPNGRNMADIHTGIHCKNEGVQIVALAHKAQWIIHQPIDFNRTIYALHRADDFWQTKILNEAGPWPALKRWRNTT